MSIILNIDTTSSIAYVNIANGGAVLVTEKNEAQKDHAAFLQPAIERLLQKAAVTLEELAAVAVSIGPGSYTGIRVGLSSAKGLCYVLNKPLIALSSLEILAKDAAGNTGDIFEKEPLFCPMIDARRMEVFTAVYDRALNIVMEPAALVLTENSYVNMLLNQHVIFVGSGMEKWKQVCRHPHAHFATTHHYDAAMSSLSFSKLTQKEFADIAYTSPLYVKEFHDTPRNY